MTPLSGIFSQVKFLALQQPLILLVSMMTGANVTELMTMHVFDRLKLIEVVLQEILEVVQAGIAAVDPDGPGGVTLTEEEFQLIVDEAGDPKIAVQALLDSFSGGEDAGES